MYNRWIRYFWHDFPLGTLAFTSLGIVVSGSLLTQSKISLGITVVSFLAVFFFFVTLQLIEDYQSYQKIRIAFPKRFLLQGEIKREEIRQALDLIPAAMFAYGMVIWVFKGATPALAAFLMGVYIWLRLRDFFMEKWLNRHPLANGVIKQLSTFPVSLLAVSMVSPGAVFSPKIFAFFLLLFGAFYIYEIGHQLSPRAHPAMATYVHYYGFRHTFEIAAVCLAISAMGAASLNLGWILFPAQMTVLIALAVLFFNADKYLAPQLASTLSLFVHAWAVALGH